jgi:hypothetical protein
MATLLAAFALLAGTHAPQEHVGFLAFAETPRRPGNMLSRYDVVGHSGRGGPIELWQYGDPAWSGELLVFGCVHGDECGARGVVPLTGGCPDPSADVYVVPNLDPDGAAAGSRLNGRGVDLNRNFPAGWKLRGERGAPEYPGPRPFSEPESRLAADRPCIATGGDDLVSPVPRQPPLRPRLGPQRRRGQALRAAGGDAELAEPPLPGRVLVRRRAAARRPCAGAEVAAERGAGANGTVGERR